MNNFIYKYSPNIIQNILISLYGLYWKNKRYGGVFRSFFKEVKQRENFTKENWNAFQTKELRRLLIHAYKNVPFYNKLYTEKGFSLNDFEKFEIDDLQKLPFLEKEDLRKFGKNLLLSKKKSTGSFLYSSGSTGTPIAIYFSKNFHRKWTALYEARVRNWAGVNYKHSRAMIGGRRVLLTAKKSKNFYRYNFAEKQAYFSAYHISNKSTSKYILQLKKTRVVYLVGYATSIYLLAKFALEQKLDIPKMKCVLTSSEKLTYSMRNTIQEAFQCNVYDAYSGVEACGLISENEFGELMFSPDSGIMEVVDANGNYVANGESGEVIATGFLNYDQPLIRYRIGDCVTLAKNQVSKGNIHMPIIDEIDGRVEDVIKGVNGNVMVRFHGIFINIEGIMLTQIIQHKLNEIEIKLVTDKNYSASSEKVMKNRIISQLGKVSVVFNYVNSMDNYQTGKYKAVISHI